MKKLLFIIVAMVLLSGAAWGQTIYKHGGWTLVERPDSYSVEFIEPRSGDRYAAVFEKKPSGDNWSASAETRITSAERLKECYRMQAQGFAIGCLEDGLEWGLIQKEKPPWADSRYRLEKNEVTGKCRVTEFRDNRWKPAHGRDLFGYSCEQASEHLEEYRQSEREDRAWKPIR